MTTASPFTTTSWTLIYKARDGDGLAELLERYWSPIYAYLRGAGKSEADALDLTQGFLASRLIEKQSLLERADHHRGKFRSYLLTSLQNYVRDERRHETPKSGPCFVPGDPTVIAAVEPGPEVSPVEAFERQYATATLDAAIRQIEADCRAAGMDRQWRAFEARELLPQTRGTNPIPIEDLVAELKAESRQQVYDMVETVKKKFQRTFREVVNQIVESPDDVEEELARLRGALGS